ncbi:MAG: Crp/Fnr family transcriptional regulator [Bacteriovoracaceae bacterium]|nr:Crp/Fnr family transcriptional regulator [Bacteriovoracaceae bacterium]
MLKRREEFSCENCKSSSKSIFCDLELLSLKSLSENKQIQQIKKGQALFYQGTLTQGLYCVQEGKIKISKTGINGQESLLRMAQAGDVLGYRGLLSSEGHDALAVAMEDSVVCFFDKKNFLNIVQKNPSVAMNLVNKLSQELNIAEEKIVSLSQKSIKERVAELLLILKESHGVREPRGWYLEIKLKRDEMASMVGMATESLMRLLSQLEEEGYIEKDGKKIIITNEQGLIALSKVRS